MTDAGTRRRIISFGYRQKVCPVARLQSHARPRAGPITQDIMDPLGPQRRERALIFHGQRLTIDVSVNDEMPELR